MIPEKSMFFVEQMWRPNLVVLASLESLHSLGHAKHRSLTYKPAVATPSPWNNATEKALGDVMQKTR